MVSATTSITLFLAALFSLSAPALAGLSIGGASAAQNLFVKAYVPAFNALGKGTATFVSSTSQDGINGFKSGTYDIGVSAVAMNIADEAGLKKLTVPTAVVTFSLFTGTGVTFSITGKQVASILLGTITTWNQIPGSGLSGSIVFVTRSDTSGTTAVFSQFLAATNPGWKYIGEGPFTYPNPNVVYAKGSSGVLTALKAAKTTLAVLQTGIGKPLNELKVQNKAGNYVASTIGTGSFIQALPRVTPPPTASWHGVSLIYQNGVETYPIVSFLYTFYHVQYSSPSQSLLVKNFGKFALSPSGQGLNSAQYFYSVPSQYTKKSLRAIKAIK